MVFALIGNQNCGKTTLFNRLTGAKQHVGNFPGVTVEQKTGAVIGHKNISVTDLPGIYSLTPYTAEETVTRDFLLKSPDIIINIADATNLERNLYLTLQLTELELPMVLALNMMDEIHRNGGVINTQALESALGIPVIPICANKGNGVKELISRALETAAQHKKPRQIFHFNEVAALIGRQAQKAGVPLQFACTALLQQDVDIQKKIGISPAQTEEIQSIAHMLGDVDAVLADMRYTEIEKICAAAVKKKNNKQQKRSERIDRVLTNKYFGIPIFLLIMFIIFVVTFGLIGPVLSGFCAQGINLLANAADAALTKLNINPVLHSLLIDGICTGVGSVLSFLPLIVTLFFFLSILEDSGYMARAAFLMDRPLRKIGLSGRSFVPMLIGFGCSVPAILSARTLASQRDRKMTILLIPFMSCSAKVPIYALFTAAFFPMYLQPIVMTGLYLFGILTGILSALLFKKTLFKGKAAPFVMELPEYRLPTGKTVFIHMWEKAKEFIIKAFTVIFIANIIIWFLQTFDFGFSMVTNPENSILAAIGKWICVCFIPLGFNDWRAVTALITGLTAKEAVISTLAILTGAAPDALSPALHDIFRSIPAVLSFLTFTLLYMPCAAATGTMRREFGEKTEAAFSVLYQMLIAWIAAFIVYHIANFCK